ncbi:hypothetical protein IWW55_002265 [Coemansia sp. RSA 2706]|nr:hypothetical protein IWW55_002265 [Coemansia sp. RSA 2706]
MSVLSIVAAASSWTYANTETSPYDGTILNKFEFGTRVLLIASALVGGVASWVLPANKAGSEKAGRTMALMAVCALVACTAMLDPMVPIAIGNSGTNAILVKAGAIACMVMGMIGLVFQLLSSCAKRA